MESRENLRFNTDYFGVLPKHLVSHILSKLPTKDAIKTSILSKRWRFRWTTITKLDFSDDDIYDVAYHDEGGQLIDIDDYDASFKCFTDRVNGVLSQLETTSIDKLSILLIIYSGRERVKEWICAALKRNVRDLGLYADVFMGDPIEVPRQVFDCKSLEALTLNVGVVFNIPEQEFVCFPNLKFLSLDNIDIGGIPAKESSACFPKLETLRLNFVTFVGRDNCVMKLVRNCPALKNLSIAKYVGDVVSNKDIVSNKDMCIPSLTSAHLFFMSEKTRPQVEVEAPTKHLRITFSNPAQNVLVKTLDSLIAIQLDMAIFSNFQDEKAQRSLYHFQGGQWDQIKLIKTCRKVKCLALTADTVYAIQASNIELPLFCNLTRLVVVLRCNELCVLLRLLNNSLNLQHLIVIKKSDLPCCGEDKRWTDSGPATDIEESRFWHEPKCLLTRLKLVEIQHSSGCSCDLNMIRNMLKWAQILKRLIIKSKSEHFDSLRDKISAFPRASAACQVDFDVVNHRIGRSYFEDIIIPRSMEHESFLNHDL